MDPSRRIRIALVDDHHLVREGLRLVLSSVDSLEVVGEAATHQEAFDLVASARCCAPSRRFTRISGSSC